MQCLVCHSPEVDKHHIKTRGSGGGDEPSNLLNLCRRHHQEIHRIGSVSFVMKYPQVKIYIMANGWMIENEFGVLKLRRFTVQGQ